MRNSKKRILPLILGVLSALMLVGMTFFVSPSSSLTLVFVSLPASIFYLILIALTTFFLSRFFLKSKRHGVLISFFIVLYLSLRLWGFTHPFFAFLLLALFLTLELLFTRKHA